MRKKGDCPVALLGCVRSPQTTVLVIECFLQAIKDHAVGILNLAIGPRVSH
jgi:hypothetical protein